MGYMSGGVPSFPGFSLSQELVGWLESMTTGWWGERAGGMAGWIAGWWDGERMFPSDLMANV